MKASLITPVDCTSTTDSETDQGRPGPSHQEHPAVWPRLTYSISDLWAGRISEAVRSSWDALSLAVYDRAANGHPDEYAGLPDETPPAGAGLGRGAGKGPDIQRIIADQVTVYKKIYDRPAAEAQPKSRNWGRLLTRG